jgi:hypothetical protein
LKGHVHAVGCRSKGLSQKGEEGRSHVDPAGQCQY